MHQLSTLDSGLKVITSPISGTKSVTVLVLAGAGSRYETKDINGISHFLEHMFFKGGERYKNSSQVASAIDSIGGDFNAFTGKEYAGYFVKCASHQKEVAFDVLSDMMLNAPFLTEEIEKEKGVILEEYNMYQDTPMYQVGWDFERLLFGDQPLGWDQIGTKTNIKNFKREQFQEYKNSLYTPENTIISLSGNISEEEGLELVKKFFTFADIKRARDFEPFQSNDNGERTILQNKKTEQGHVIIGVKALPARHQDEYVEKVLSVILGGNMSSRMFMNVRESKGLCYYIRSTTDDYSDVGVLSTSAGVDLKRIDKATEAILMEYKKIMEEPVSHEELTKAKEFMKGKIVLRLEDSEELAHLMGKQALLYDSIDTVDDIFKKIDAVSVDDIQHLSQKLFPEENLRLAAIGPYKNKNHFTNLLHY